MQENSRLQLAKGEAEVTGRVGGIPPFVIRFCPPFVFPSSPLFLLSGHKHEKFAVPYGRSSRYNPPRGRR
jgi:hypothetical protein